MAAKGSGGRRYGKAASERVGDALHRQKRGTLKSGKGGAGGRVKSRKQAIAIALSEAREAGARVPPAPRKGARKSAAKSAAKSARKAPAKRARKTAAKKTAAKKTAAKRTAAKKTARKAARKAARTTAR